MLPPDTGISKYINAAGPQYKDPAGNVWKADASYVNIGSTLTTDTAISGTLLDPLFQSKQYDTRNPSQMVYNIPLPKGNYDIFLNFAEIYFGSVGSHVFDVKLEGSLEFVYLDVFNEAGGAFKLVMKRKLALPITDSALTTEFVCKIQNPKIQAIGVHLASTAPIPPTQMPVPPPPPTPLSPPPDNATSKFINVGGPEYVDPATGNIWEADATYISRGTPFMTTAAISKTLLIHLYQSELYDNSEPSQMTFIILLPNGN